MNMKEVKELIELVSEKGFAEFEIEHQGFRLHICRFKEPPATALPPVATPVIISSPLPVAADAAAIAPATAPPATAPAQPEAAAPEAVLHVIKSPIVGTFYRAPSPNLESFVKIGDHVEIDSVVCIIEAMKLMNEIQSDVNGEVVKVYVENGQAVEYGQPLFGIKV